MAKKKLTKGPGPVARAKLSQMEKDKAKEWTALVSDQDDGDYAEVLDVLRFKLERVRAHIATRKLVKDSSRISKEIRKVTFLLGKVIADEYEERRSRRFFAKHGIQRKLGVDSKGVIRTGVPDDLREEFMAEMDAAFDERKSDLKRAFDMMADDIWRWWE